MFYSIGLRPGWLSVGFRDQTVMVPAINTPAGTSRRDLVARQDAGQHQGTRSTTAVTDRLFGEYFLLYLGKGKGIFSSGVREEARYPTA